MVYSGSIERVDFGERKEDKGFCHVTIHEKNYATYEFIKTPIRPFIQLEVHLVDTADHTEQILSELEKYTLAQAVIKIVYHVPAGCKDRVDVTLIQKACFQAWYLVGIFPVRAIGPRERRAVIENRYES